ncbi:MAG: hypothetical protein SPH68_06325 [Candidatus Borkfalkiaceae bacterium]|nr:hypothetical protein [Clostridia bacterium]MDY6223753.1 hypothetical protein [Christensenellaceae bacterium]
MAERMRGAYKRSLCVFICAATICTHCFFTRSCTRTADEPEGKMTFALSREEIELTVGEECVLYLIKTPADGKKTPVSWKTNDLKIAEVNGGRIRAKAAGETFVSAQTREYTLSCKVTVKMKNAGENGGKTP